MNGGDPGRIQTRDHGHRQDRHPHGGIIPPCSSGNSVSAQPPEEVSTGIAQLFSEHAADYQALAGQAAAFNEQFVQHLTAGAFAYASIEAALASLLQSSITDAGAFISYVATWTPEDWLIAIGSALFLQLTVAVFATPILLIVGIAVLGHFFPAR